MKNNKLTPKEGQQLTLDLIDFVTENPNELDWLCDEYVYSLSDNGVKELIALINKEDDDD